MPDTPISAPIAKGSVERVRDPLKIYPGSKAPSFPNLTRNTANLGKEESKATGNEGFDEYGAELDPEARVWKKYVEVADKVDGEQVEGWNRSLDVTLLFAGLFTAICTAFVIESSKTLRQEAAEKSDYRLEQIVKILLTTAGAPGAPGFNSTQAQNLQSFSPRPIDLCINALWFFSLILSASVSLVSMLAKQWCYQFLSRRTGDPWTQTKRRQQLWDGIVGWGMEEVIMFLPSFIHLSFFGLCIYLWDLHRGVAIPAVVVTFLVILVYVASTLLPFQYGETCPYSTTVTRLIYRLARVATGKNNKSGKNSDGHDKGTLDRIAIKALAWLIEASEDQVSTDIALQAIAGADGDADHHEDRALLKRCNADTMICRRLIDLDSYSSSYQQILDLYSRAQYFFQPSSDAPAEKSGGVVSVSVSEKRISDTNGEVRKNSEWGSQKDLNRELQKKLRNLRKVINKQITVYVTSSDPIHPFLPTPDNILALRIGGTSASHCLRSLQQHGQEDQMQDLFDSVIALLENYKNRQARLSRSEVDYLMTGAAILLSSLLVDFDSPSTVVAHNIMSLVQMVDRVANTKEQRSLKLDDLHFPLLVFALSRYDYPGWIRSPPLTAVSRAERAIDAITYYVEKPLELTYEVTSAMTNLGLLELLSKPRDYGLTGDQLKTISEAFILRARDTQPIQIHTFAPSFESDIYSRTLRSIDRILSAESSDELDSTVAATAYLTVLNQTRATQGDSSRPPSGRTYAFIAECICSSILLPGPENYTQNTALDLMEHFLERGYLPRISGLVQSFREKGALAQLKAVSEEGPEATKSELVLKMFATSQVWLLISLALESGNADSSDWRLCLAPFIGDESQYNTRDLVNGKLDMEKKTLANRYGDLYRRDSAPYHSYFKQINERL